MTDERAAAPVLRDVAEHPVFDLVPLAGSGREVANVDGHFQSIGQALQRELPKTTTATVAAAAVGGNEQFFRALMSLRSHFLPPSSNRLGGEVRGVVVDADADLALVLGHVINAVWDRLTQLLVHEVVD